MVESFNDRSAVAMERNVHGRDSMICVALTCFNEGPFIGEAVRSVLAQTRQDLIESIVIADDGSGPETVSVLRDISTWDARIHVIYGPGGQGLPAQRNLALRRGAGELLAILDGDDVWMPNKLELQLGQVTDPEVGLCYSGYCTFEDGARANLSRAPVRDISNARDLTTMFFLHDPPIIPSTILMRRDRFEGCGGFDASIRVFEDTDFYLRLSRECRFSFVPEPLLHKRLRRSSITGGRRDLMAHHALVALKAAADEPRLLDYVPQRLSERARKLSNHRLLEGDVEDSLRLSRFAVKLNPWNFGAWMAYVAARLPRFARRRLSARVSSGKVLGTDA